MKILIFRIFITAIFSITMLLGLIYTPYIEMWEIYYLDPNLYVKGYFVIGICVIAFIALNICIYKLLKKE